MTARDTVRPLLRTRQIRDFTDELVSDEALAALADVGRWSGSSSNNQPWRFLVLRDPVVLRRLEEIGLPQTRAFHTAVAGIAIVLTDDPKRELPDAYDDGRAAERLLVAASMLDLGAAITWIRRDVRPAVNELLGLPSDRFVRTVVAFGHPTDAARQPKAAPGEARIPRQQSIFEERWPAS
jgi:nitroreductase